LKFTLFSGFVFFHKSGIGWFSNGVSYCALWLQYHSCHCWVYSNLLRVGESCCHSTRRSTVQISESKILISTSNYYFLPTVHVCCVFLQCLLNLNSERFCIHVFLYVLCKYWVLDNC